MAKQDKRQPHLFQPIPEVPIVYPRAGIALQQGDVGEGIRLPRFQSQNCALCGVPRSDRIHLDFEAVDEAVDGEKRSHWG